MQNQKGATLHTRVLPVHSCAPTWHPTSRCVLRGMIEEWVAARSTDLV